MRELLFKQLWRKWRTHVPFLLAIVFILIFIPFSIHFLQDLNHQVHSNITHYSRGSYDLLVRPKKEFHPLENELGIVPENYIGLGEGGISIEQWEKIKSHNDVEIAAPVASLGYFTGISSSINIEEPKQSTRYSAQFFTSDGINRFPVKTTEYCIFLENYFVEKEQYRFEPLMENREMLDFCDINGVAQFPLPESYHLLVGIDAEQEQLLTGTEFNFNKPGWGSRGKYEFGLHDSIVIPVIELDHPKVSLQADISVEEVNISKDQVKVWRDRIGLKDDPNEGPVHFYQLYREPEYKQIYNKIFNMPASNQILLNVDLSSDLDGFYQKAILIHLNGNTEPLIADGKYTALIDISNAGRYFSIGNVKYEKNGDQYFVKKTGEQNGIPSYREIIEKGGPLGEQTKDGPPIITDPIDKVKLKSRKEELASSPLGIYQFAPVHYIDEAGKKKKLTPTIIPGSFISAPASGVTTIEAAKEIKGDKPIDAIRVKVAGIKGYTKEAAEKIDKVAKDIEALGLQVTTVAGASHQKLKVEVEGIGTVEEAWTTLGAAGSIISEWNLTNGILAILFIVVAVIYLWNRLLFWQTHTEKEFRLLSFLGWKSSDIIRFFRKEVISLLFFATSLSLMIMVGIGFNKQLSPYIYLSLFVSSVLAFLFMWNMVGRKIRNVFRSNENSELTPMISKNEKSSLVSRNLKHFIKYIRSPFIQLFIVSLLSSFVYLSLTETVKETNLTVLGEYINIQAGSHHFLLMIIAYVLSIFTLIESISSLFIVRKKELNIFQIVGWRKKHITRLYIQELAIWSGLAIGIGSLMTGIFFTIMYSFHVNYLMILLLSFIGFYIVVLMIGYMFIRNLLKKTSLQN